MSELTTGQLIKLILGILVIVVVVTAVALFFRERVRDFFSSVPVDLEFWRVLI